MTFSLHESIEPNGAYDFIDGRMSDREVDGAVAEDFHILQGKLSVPPVGAIVPRPRLMTLLARSQKQYPATLICGRAGTGKTTLAASFARQISRVAWYTIEASDVEWFNFSQYLSSCLLVRGPGGKRVRSRQDERDVTQNDMARFLVTHFSQPEVCPEGEPSLIVLDDIHHLFDQPWFGDFFNLLLYSLPADCHLLMLCRSKPPQPMWRLRSKQMLNVLDEKVIAFDLAETQQLFAVKHRPAAAAAAAHRDSFGRVSKLLQYFPT